MLGIAQYINDGWSYEDEIKDTEVALRLYKTAYHNILDINSQINTKNISLTSVPGVCPFEVRSVGDYLNYRMCLIQFKQFKPREAISQFKKHIETFVHHTKSAEYAFEHSSWLSQQYLLFADLFSQAVANGEKASKSQQPGQYYYEAATQMMIKRQNETEFTNDEIRYQRLPITNELLSVINAESFVSFFRLCGWDCSQTGEGNSSDPKLIPRSNPSKYSDMIIKSLIKAGEGFQEWARHRMTNFINVLIADEYRLSNNYQKANNLYLTSCSLYKKEKWWPLVNYVEEKIKITDINHDEQAE